MVVIILLVALVLILYAPSMFGLKTYSVLSGSMEKSIHVGSVIYVKDISGDDAKVGDVVTFRDNHNTVVTHRVFELREDGKIVTKGDANETEDSPIEREQIIGKVMFTIPCLGYCAAWISSFAGKCFLVCTVGVCLILVVLAEALSKKEKNNSMDNK